MAKTMAEENLELHNTIKDLREQIASLRELIYTEAAIPHTILTTFPRQQQKILLLLAGAWPKRVKLSVIASQCGGANSYNPEAVVRTQIANLRRAGVDIEHKLGLGYTFANVRVLDALRKTGATLHGPSVAPASIQSQNQSDQ